MTGMRWRAAILSMLFIAMPFANIPATGQLQTEAPAAVPGIPDSEELDYDVEWRLVPAGTVKLTWNAMRPPANTGELHLHIESTGLVSRLFRVNDDYTAALGENLCAENSFLSAHEGNRNRETRVTFNAQMRKAEYVEKDLNKNLTTTHQVDVPPCVHDIVGGLMVLRTLNVEPGNTVRIPVSDGKKFVQARVESQGREDLRTLTGIRKTIRYEVFLFDNVLFKRSGHLHIWLTDDNLHLPVQLQIRLQFAIGTITLKLQKEEKS